MHSLRFFAVAVLLSACGPYPGSLTVPLLHECGGGPAPETLRVMSFNIRAALSSSIDQIAEAIAAENPDVVALQEVDVGTARSGSVDQAALIAERLGGTHVFAQTLQRDGGAYGVALVSRLPLARVSRIELAARAAFERRVAIDAEVCVGSRGVRVVATHTDIFPWSNEDNLRQIVAAIAPTNGLGLIVAGDLNATPDTSAAKRLTSLGLVDVIARHAEGPTFLDGGSRRLDYVFADLPLVSTGGKRVNIELSDHLPIVAELSLAELR